MVGRYIAFRLTVRNVPAGSQSVIIVRSSDDRVFQTGQVGCSLPVFPPPRRLPDRSNPPNRKVWLLPMYQPAPCGMMSTATADVCTLDGLRNFIHIALCRKENLLEHHFPMTELELKRNSVCCGFQFMLHGPRSVKLSAVWDRQRNEVLLYDALGRRFARTILPQEVTL